MKDCVFRGFLYVVRVFLRADKKKSDSANSTISPTCIYMSVGREEIALSPLS